MRLIDADECTSEEMIKSFPVFEEAGANVADLKELIASCKTVDAVPFVHAKWIEKNKKVFCSSCSIMAPYGVAAIHFKDYNMNFRSNFCPNCGARMDLK